MKNPRAVRKKTKLRCAKCNRLYTVNARCLDNSTDMRCQVCGGALIKPSRIA